MKALLVDYLVLSIKNLTVFDSILCQFNFNLNDHIPIKSYYGYEFCSFFNGIKIHRSIKEDIGIIDMSGKGCRTFEGLNPSFDWYAFFYMLRHYLVKQDNNPSVCHISRLDIACDSVNDDNIKLDTMMNCVKKNKFICLSHYYTIIDGNRERAIYFGSPKSSRRLRIYDKGLEQKVDDNWIRFEFQLRDDNALSFIYNLIDNCGDFTETYFSVMITFLKFVTKSKNVEKHYDRLKVCSWWQDFCENTNECCGLYQPGDIYNTFRLEQYLKVQAASSIKTYLKYKNFDSLEQLIKDCKLNTCQVELLKSLNKWEDLPFEN